ncbi:MAG TPA: hypothetical protein VMS93_06885, partial [Candidatus Saccharimonadales bacterium]|nr:hypothetical protein [Candidatus Saccharimonadales bacterium]
SAVFGPECAVSGSLVANGCVVEGEVAESVLFGGACVEAGARVTRSILDKTVRVGAGAVVGGEADITVVGKNAVVPPGVRVGAGARVDIGVRPEDFPGAEVAAGAEVVRR